MILFLLIVASVVGVRLLVALSPVAMTVGYILAGAAVAWPAAAYIAPHVNALHS